MFIRRHALSLIFVVLAGCFFLAWWNSSKFSERHLINLGPVTIDTFSANSLFRISFVKGRIENWGRKTNYRRPNPRGKFLFRPLLPGFVQRNSDIYEVTLGYWHLVTGALLIAGMIEIRLLKHSTTK